MRFHCSSFLFTKCAFLLAFCCGNDEIAFGKELESKSFASENEMQHLRHLQPVEEQIEVCDMNLPGGGFATDVISSSELEEYLADGSLAGSCEAQCGDICDAPDIDRCTTNAGSNANDQCTCLDNPVKIPVEQDEQCCGPYGNTISATGCCPIGNDECCGLSLQECIEKISPPGHDNAYTFQESVVGPLPENQFFPSYILKEDYSDLGPANYTAVTEDGYEFDIRVLGILSSATDTMASFTNGLSAPSEVQEVSATFKEDAALIIESDTDDEEIIALQENVTQGLATLQEDLEALSDDLNTPPMSQTSMNTLKDRNIGMSLVHGDAEIVNGPMAGERKEFVAMINRYTNLAGQPVSQFIYFSPLDDVGSLLSVPSGESSNQSVRKMKTTILEEKQRSRELQGDPCDLAYQAAKSAAEQTFCPNPEDFMSDAACEAALVAECQAAVAAAYAKYDLLVTLALAAFAALKALFALQKLIAIAEAIAACIAAGGFWAPWLTIACIAAAIILIEINSAIKCAIAQLLLDAALDLAEHILASDIAEAIVILISGLPGCWSCKTPAPNTPKPTPAPEPGPTPTPAPEPTHTPAPEPTPTPAPAPTPVTPSPDPGVIIDPHIIKWGGKTFDVYALCDLILFANPDFRDGLGLEVQMRTVGVALGEEWNGGFEQVFAEQMVLHIGDSILEVGGVRGAIRYWLDGVDLGYIYRGDPIPPTISMDASENVSFPVTFHDIDVHRYEFHIHLSGDVNVPGGVLRIELDSHFINMHFHNVSNEDKGSGLGLMGRVADGVSIARDGVTVIEDSFQAALEWQVREDEPMIFHDIGDGVHAPEQCILPSGLAEGADEEGTHNE